MIIFRKIRFKNFLATGNTFTEVALNTHHTTILLGPSGSGKSTLLDAITFALFNKPFRNISKPNLVNSINKKNCLVEVEFALGEKDYLVRRGIKPNIFEIYLNGQMVHQDASSRDYQLEFERDVLKFNIKSFKQIVVLGAAGFTPFMQLKPNDRRTIIEELLDIEIFSMMNVILKQKMSTIKTDLEKNEFDINLLKEKIILHEKYIQDLSKNKEEKINENLDKIRKNKEQIIELEKENAEYEVMLNELSDKISFKKEVEENTALLNTSKNRLERKRNNIEKEIKFFEENENCPTCEQHISDGIKQIEIEKRTLEIDDICENIEKVQSTLEKLSEKLEKAEELQKEMDEVQHCINKNINSVDGIQQYIKKIGKEILELRKSTNDSGEAESELLVMDKQVQELHTSKEKLVVEKSVHDLAYDLLKDSGVKSKIIKQYLPLINKYTNQFLTYMNFFVTFYIDEEFNEAIKHRGRDDFVYENLSEGEKQRLDLALLFTWRKIARMKNSINTNLLIMDEVFDSYLDLNATENVIQLLKSDMFKNSNIFVISHKETISDKFDQTIRFTKTKNFSIIEK